MANIPHLNTKAPLYIFAFSKYNISARVMYELTTNFKTTSSKTKSESFLKSLVAHRYLLFKHKTIARYIDILLREQPKYILGLGQYTGRDQDKIRIEIMATNRFRNSKILLQGVKQMQIPYFLQPRTHSKIVKALGNSWCSLVSYKITELIISKKLNAEFTFLHIPKSMNIELATTEIIKMLHNYFENYL